MKNIFPKKVVGIILTVLLIFSLSDTSVCAENNENTKLKLTEQTLTHSETGIKVSGLMPEDVELYASFEMIYLYGLSENPEYEKSLAENYDMSLLFSDIELNSEMYNKELLINEYDSTGNTYIPCLRFAFCKDDEIIEFKSDLTVTIPDDYRSFLAHIKKDSELKAYQLDYNTDTLKSVELIPNDNSIVFKANSYGCYFLGTNSFMNEFTANYSYYYNSTLEMYINNTADADIYKTESANT